MRFAVLVGLLLLCAFFENLGDAGGYLAKTTRDQLGRDFKKLLEQPAARQEGAWDP